jgi:heat shock protein HslJ
MAHILGWGSGLILACWVRLAGGMPQNDGTAAPDPAHNSRNAIDWAGTYEGVTPCADCPGIRMRLSLQPDGRFALNTQYLDRQVARQTVLGPFTWNLAGDTVTLEGNGDGRQFRVGEGRLLWLDGDGGVPSWSEPSRVLTRQPAADAGTSAPQPPPGTPDASLAPELRDHRWTLQTATDADGKPIEALLVPGHPFVIHLEGERIGIQGGCNQLSGGWQLNPRSQLKVGPLASTMKACEAPLMAADQAMALLLAQPLQASVEPGQAPRLHLLSPERQMLSFVGQRTPQSLYGAPTRIFLEVAPQRVACTPTPMPPTTCLQVRERQFDDQGLRVGEPGPWQTFYGEIEGYTHQPGVRNVVRINRFKRPPPPADASAYVYVLDLVVESEIVDKK